MTAGSKTNSQLAAVKDDAATSPITIHRAVTARYIRNARLYNAIDRWALSRAFHAQRKANGAPLPSPQGHTATDPS